MVNVELLTFQVCNASNTNKTKRTLLVRTAFDLAVEFQDVAMSIDFLESGDFVIGLMRTDRQFDGHVNAFTCFGIFFPLSFVNTTVTAFVEETLAVLLGPTDFKDLF